MAAIGRKNTHDRCRPSVSRRDAIAVPPQIRALASRKTGFTVDGSSAMETRTAAFPHQNRVIRCHPALSVKRVSRMPPRMGGAPSLARIGSIRFRPPRTLCKSPTNTNSTAAR